MRSYATIKVKNDLQNSRVPEKLPKPLDSYEFRVIERNDSGCLCVVLDDQKPVCIADVAPGDIDRYLPADLPRLNDIIELLSFLAKSGKSND
jgi:hypothetical protein